MKCVAGRGSLIYLAAIAHLALLPCLPAVSAEGNKPEVHVSVDPTSSDEASQATQGSILDNSVSIEEGALSRNPGSMAPVEFPERILGRKV
ncbi:hypothetical protein cyc_03894 [Cyclospora cayetanensis]|uniref:Uncharacterized protein n=1 Tax=Cyclospora cayetanensis TaxID=88456 RepID=A0A1D3CWK3_9EIME|nr:hypothetical protein cyc_03894 [Cyclospora cayetanensis]